MDFLLSTWLVKYEILFLILNLIYLFFHIFFELFTWLKKIKNIVKPKRNLLDEEELRAAIQEKVESINEIDSPVLKNAPVEEVQNIDTVSELESVSQEPQDTWLEEEKQEDSQIKEYSEIELSKDQKQAISDIVKLVKSKLSRWEYSDAKAKIIEWLSIDKFNKDLNVLLASLYEKDKDYKKAELIYKDLIVLNDHDTEIYLKLWFILSIQTKYEVAYEIYKKLHTIDKSNTEAVEMLCNLAHHLWNYEDSKHYSKIFLKKSPNNIDILYLQSLNLINLNDRKGALEFLQKVRQLEPYNVKVNELVEKVKLEIELEKNFNTSWN